MNWEIREGDALTSLREMPDESVQCCITSPPYWGLRDYGTGNWVGGDPNCDHGIRRWDGPKQTQGAQSGKAAAADRLDRKHCESCGADRVDLQLGMEPTPDDYVARMVEIFAEVRRVLRDDGTLWLNLGDSYNSYSGNRTSHGPISGDHRGHVDRPSGFGLLDKGIKNKDLIGIPWMVAFALRADGWYLRRDIIWSKPNPMPESVTDRPTSSHEYLFLLTKKPRYFYDADAIREAHTMRPQRRPVGRPADRTPRAGQPKQGWSMAAHDEVAVDGHPDGRNKRSVWSIPTHPFPDAHFATFPPKLVEPCILAGTGSKICPRCEAPWVRIVEREIDDSKPRARQNIHEPEVTRNGDGTNSRGSSTWGHHLTSRTVGWKPTCEHEEEGGIATALDPFAGAGTTGLVAVQQGRNFIGIELNPEYAEMGRERIRRWEANPSGDLKGDPEPIEGQIELEMG